MFRRALLALAAGLSFAAHAALTPPVTVAPTGTHIGAYPTYTWKAVAGAMTYPLLVQTAAGADVFQKILFPGIDVSCHSESDGTQTCQSTPNVFGSGIALANGGSYYWFIASQNASETSGWSVGRPFTVVTSVPPAPHQVAPTGTVSTMTPFYLWAPAATASSYNLTVRGDGLEVFSGDLTLAQAGCPANTGACGIELPIALKPNTSYLWWVRGSNVVGMGPSEPTETLLGGKPFSTGAAMGPPPAAPAIASPTGIIDTAMPEFLWSPSPGATSYVLTAQGGGLSFLGSGGFRVGLTLDDADCPANTGMCGYTWSVPLNRGVPFEWSVTAGNANGSSAPSATGSFTITAPVAGVPPIPVPGSPSGNIDTLTPMLLWSPSPGATGYSVVVAYNGTNTYNLTLAEALCPANAGACGFTVPLPLLSGTTYSWNVRATNANGSSPLSPTMFFTTPSLGAAPPAPVLGSPSGAVATLTPMLLWNPSPGATSYTVRLSSAAGSTDYALTLAMALCPGNTGACGVPAPPGLVAGTTYTWSVRAHNAAGASAFSTGMSFTTPSAGSPPAPVNAPAPGNPAGPIATLTPMFLWTPVPGATAYTVKLMNGAAVVFETTLTLAQALCPGNAGACGHTATADLSPGTTYGWQVRAENASGAGPYSGLTSFTTQSNVCTSSTPFAPAVGAPSGAAGTLTPFFLWTPSPAATSYTLRILEGGTTVFSSPLTLLEAMCPSNTGACGHQLASPLAAGRSYLWTVAASNCAGMSEPSAAGMFSTP